MEQKNEKIMGLAYRAVDHKYREILQQHHVETTETLAKINDERLEDWGIAKVAIKGLRKIQKSLGYTTVKKELPGKRLLTVMNENSVIDYGKFEGLTVGNLLEARKTRSLRWLYYHVSYVDFTDDIKRRIGLTHIIDKPGTDPLMHELNNEEAERNIHGDLKLKMKMNISKDLRLAEIANRKSHARDLTKGKMAWANQGHVTLTLQDDKVKPGDRPFAKDIVRGGYNLPKTVKAKEQPVNFQSLYNAFLKTVPNNITEEKQRFLANILFKDYILEHFPSYSDEAQTVLFRDFTCPAYYDMLERLGLEYENLIYILSFRQPTFKYLTLSCPLTGERFFLKDMAIETQTDDGMRLMLFDEGSFVRRPLEEVFRGYVAQREIHMDKDGSYLIRLRDVEDHIKEAMSRPGVGSEAMTSRQRSGTRGRAPQNFDFKMKDGRLLIRPHNDRTPLLYEPFPSWTEKNTKSVLTLLLSLEYPIVSFYSKD